MTEVDLGLRDYGSWMGDALPGRVGAADLDFVLEQSRTGRVLIHEYKPPHAQLPTGQRLLLKRFARMDLVDVWVVWENVAENWVEVGAMDRNGQVPFVQRMPIPRFKMKVAAWWKAGLEDAS